MAVPDLVSYIQEQTQQGVSAHVLREALLEVGWQSEDVDNALHDVAAGLHPVTTGASLHEDLAQVRGMVAHLATRVQRIEGTLLSVPTSAAAPQALIMPPASLAPVRAMPAKQGADILRFFLSLVIAGGGAFYLSLSAVTAPPSQLVGAGILGVGLLFGALVVMRRHSWLASILTGLSMALLLLVTDAVWRVQKIIETQTAVALMVLWLVVMIVVERWIRRFERSMQ